VPLLVSLFTDSTPATTKSMIEIFRENGEVVLSLGSAYRSLVSLAPLTRGQELQPVDLPGLRHGHRDQYAPW
jgi:hypothetical protein